LDSWASPITRNTALTVCFNCSFHQSTAERHTDAENSGQNSIINFIKSIGRKQQRFISLSLPLAFQLKWIKSSLE
jgi:hypothetical protein